MDTVWFLFVAVTFLTGVTGQGLVIESVRLVGGPNASSGRVEVRVQGVWGTVCDDEWDNLDASVVCKQLNFTNGGEARDKAFFGSGSGPIYLDNVKCDGSEPSIGECLFVPLSSDCTHTEDAGVVCIPNSASPPASATTTPAPTVAPVPDNCNPTNPAQGVRIAGYNNTQGMGIVEVNNGGVWGTVCDDFFDENAARVVCRSLCFDPTFARAGADPRAIGPPRFNITLDNVRCNGNENRIQDCNHAPWNTHNCGELEVATVTCRDLNSQPPEPPAPILECRQGFLIAAFNKSRDRNLEPKHLTVANPVVGSCDLQYNEDDDTVVIRIPFAGCGTNVQLNTTHLIYSNVIKYDRTTQERDISRVNTYLVEVYCEMPRNVGVTEPFDPKTEVVTQKSTGRFVVTMTFYRNNSFTNPVTETPLRLPVGEWLNVALQLESIDSRLKLVVPDCVATPDQNMNNPINYPLFQDSCRNEPSLSFFNLNQTRFGYRYQSFMFVNFPQVFLHCGAFVCLLTEDTAQCDRSCNSSKPQPTTTGRRKREAPKEKIYVHSGPLIVYKLDNSMAVLERVGNPQTYRTTFTVPLPTTTPMPDVSDHIGTSVKVIYHSSSTTPKTNEISGSGDGGVEFMTSSQEGATDTNKIEITTKQNDVSTETSFKKSTINVAATLKKDVTTGKPFTVRQTSTNRTPTHTPITVRTQSETPYPGDGFFIERKADPISPSSSQNQNSNVLRAYIPQTSDSPRFVPSILTLLCVCRSVAGILREGGNTDGWSREDYK